MAPTRNGFIETLREGNCAAIPSDLTETMLFGHVRGAFTGADRSAPGLFEQVAGGSVLLDEIGEKFRKAAFRRVGTVDA